ncbi:DUF1761 domain-containing protein [Pseudolysinimonas sp.]|uniref:DUF1761 domain-containing protein n=1 Tax=Pseudolysinimonas sp. TaxID=2680009 RepID=UPI00286BAB34|nr:DUF1761 domain-containing protein [Pseudolysinimonas sp.]
MDFSLISWLGVAVAGVTAMVIGGLWYSLLFAKPWQRASGVTDEQLTQNAPLTYLGSLLLAFVMALVLAPFIAGGGLLFGTFAGLAVGLGWVATSLGMVYLFERRPFAHWAVNAGYAIVSYTAMGAIIGAFQA